MGYCRQDGFKDMQTEKGTSYPWKGQKWFRQAVEVERH